MDKVLRPERLDIDPASADASDEFRHWHKTFQNYLAALSSEEIRFSQLEVLTNLVSPKVYRNFAEENDFDRAIAALQRIYVKPKNVIAARHELRICKQQPCETIDQFVLRLEQLSKQCDFKEVTAEQNRLEYMRDALIAGLMSNTIRLRLLEDRNLSFQDAYDRARAQELAHKNSEAYQDNFGCRAATGHSLANQGEEGCISTAKAAVSRNTRTSSCYFCGGLRHSRTHCPAKDATCNFCGVIGHFIKVCRKRKNSSSTSAMISTSLSEALASSKTENTTGALSYVKINGVTATSLMDTGSSDCFVDREFANKNSFTVQNCAGQVTLAETSVKMPILGRCLVDLRVKNNEYKNVPFNVLNNLSTDVIIGERIFK